MYRKEIVVVISVLTFFVICFNFIDSDYTIGSNVETQPLAVSILEKTKNVEHKPIVVEEEFIGPAETFTETQHLCIISMIVEPTESQWVRSFSVLFLISLVNEIFELGGIRKVGCIFRVHFTTL